MAALIHIERICFSFGDYSFRRHNISPGRTLQRLTYTLFSNSGYLWQSVQTLCDGSHKFLKKKDVTNSVTRCSRPDVQFNNPAKGIILNCNRVWLMQLSDGDYFELPQSLAAATQQQVLFLCQIQCRLWLSEWLFTEFCL
jgi:hypothetical protein